MPESPSSSFIPKRGVGKKQTTVRKSNFVLLSIISYALFVSAPLASAAVFIYERHTQNQFDKAVVLLDEAIENFKDEDLTRVTEFAERLAVTKSLLATHVSIETLLKNIEAATAQTVAFKSIDITRVDKSTISVNGILETEKFDGALYQRSSYDAKELIQNPFFSEVKLILAKVDEKIVTSDSKKIVEFKVAFTVLADDILYSSLFSQIESASTADIAPVVNGDTDTFEITNASSTSDDEDLDEEVESIESLSNI